MIILLQLAVFLITLAIRGRFLLGSHLKPSTEDADVLTYISKSRYGRTSRFIGVRQTNGIPFIIRPERWYHRLLKKMGFSAEVNISNGDFDEKYFITTDYPTHLERALASSELHQYLKDLFELPIKSLHSTSNKIWCEISRNDIAEVDQYYHRHIKLLRQIADVKLSLLKRGHEFSPTKKLGILAILFICIHAGLVTLGFAGRVSCVCR